MSTWVDLHAVGMIVGFGLLAGAGLPALFALGLRALNASGNGGGEPPAESSSAIVGGSTAGLAVAVICFAVVVAAIAWGFYFIIAG